MSALRDAVPTSVHAEDGTTDQVQGLEPPST